MQQGGRRSLGRVGSRKEFMDTLYDMNHPPKSRRPGRDPQGRFTELKTYMLERNGGFGPGRGERVSWDIGNTGVDSIKILTVKPNKEGAPLQFYMDTSDKRFVLLHTDELAEDAGDAMEHLVEDGHGLDHAWFHSSLMKKWARELGGEFGGYVMNYGGLLSGKDDTLKMEVGGSNAKWVYRVIEQQRGADRIMSHEAIGVSRGQKKTLDGYVEERISNTGYFAIKRGRSIQDHLHIVSDCKDEYAGMVGNIEKCAMGASKRGGVWVFGGNPIEITYPEISRLGQFVDTMFSATKPFRLWGIKVGRGSNYYSVPAVDLHEGSAINFEITPTFMRVYTRRGSCGNTILRLLTNLQIQYNASAKCSELE